MVTIGDYAFANCDALTEVHLPDSVKALGAAAFGYCDNLSKINYPLSLEEGPPEPLSYDDPDSLYGNTFVGILVNTPNVTVVEVPEGVTRLPAYIFHNCKYLEQVTLPSSLTSIGDQAFKSCTEMVRIYIPASVTSIARDAFDNCPKLKIVRQSLKTAF